MTGPVYLYSHGTKRHIADPVGADINHTQRALCGIWAASDETMAADLHRWNAAPVAERYIRRKRGAPVCKSCQRSWDWPS